MPGHLAGGRRRPARGRDRAKSSGRKQFCVFEPATEAEALARWRQPSQGLASPAEFIPLAEGTGLIPLGEWVLREACVQAMAWPSETKVAVNLSPVQFRKGDLVRTVAEAPVDSGLAPERLELEITESVLVHNNDDNLATLAALKCLGVSIMLDDFGTGYSSMSYLKMFPFDNIKIDRSFVGEICAKIPAGRPVPPAELTFGAALPAAGRSDAA